MPSLRIIFMGTPEFAVPSLEILIKNGYAVVAAVTAPDKPSGRGLNQSPSPLKECALKHSIPVLQPVLLKSEDFQQTLQSYKANLQIVVAFRMLPEAVWRMPELGTINLHASLLPDYRGAAPINWALINGERETGVTTFFLRHDIDTGNVIYQIREPIHADDDAGSLQDRLKEKGAELVLKTVRAIESGAAPSVPQPVLAEVKTAPKIFRDDCQIRWDRPYDSIRNFVRGLSPYPAAWSVLNSSAFKIFKVSKAKSLKSGQVGELDTDQKKYLYVKAADGWISIDELQPEGRKRMSTEEFLRGNRFHA